MLIRKFFAQVDNGKITIRQADRTAYQSLLQKFEGKSIIISLSLPHKNRTISENRYYWGVVVEILANFFGYTKHECHDALKHKFLSVPGDIMPGKLPVVKSTAELSTTEFEEYLDNIRTWALLDLGINIPLPNEVLVDV